MATPGHLETQRQQLVRLALQMTLDFMICMAMFGNGAGTFGMPIILWHRSTVLPGLLGVTKVIAFSGAVHGKIGQ